MAWDRLLRERLFEASLAFSLAAHFLLWGVAAWLRSPGAALPMPVLEVDLSAPFKPRSPWDTRLPGAAKGMPAPAPKPVPGGAGRKPADVKIPASPMVAAPAPAVPPKEWVLPGPDTRQLEKPVLSEPAPPLPSAGGAPGGSGPGGEGGLGGSGGGPGTGEAWINRPPRLVNVEEIRASLRRHYPESERRAGREGSVTVAIVVSAEGRVQGVEVLDSAGAAFDEAAKSVARRMIFEPALERSAPVAVRVRQAVVFRLEE